MAVLKGGGGAEVGSQSVSALLPLYTERKSIETGTSLCEALLLGVTCSFPCAQRLVVEMVKLF